MDIQISYKEYSATAPKVLLNIIDFNYCSMAMCNLSTTLKFIETSSTDASYFEKKYQKELGEMESPSEGDIRELRYSLYRELSEKGYNINNTVEPVIHNE